MVEFFEDADLVFEKLLCYCGSKCAEPDNFDSDRPSTVSINSTKDLTEIALSNSVTQIVVIVIYLLTVLNALLLSVVILGVTH